MKSITIENLAKIIKAQASMHADGSSVTDICTDSRTVKPGDCFFAISGENFDGHNFIEDVFAKGAACAVVSKEIPSQKFNGRPILKVPDTIKALGELAGWYRKDGKFKVVAITGSAGKTTTRQIAYHALANHFKVHQSPKSFNNFIGLPLTLLGARPDDDIVIVELGTNHPGEIEYLAKIASPYVALITNVYPAHLAGFGTIGKIAEEKLAVIKGLDSRGTLIINADCQTLLDTARRLKLPFEKFSCFNDDADYYIDNLVIGPLASNFNIDRSFVEIPLAGRGNIENALAAWAICSRLGIRAAYFADAVKTINPVSMRAEVLQAGSVTIISDCYNANPASMKNALDILTNFANSQKRRAVFICGDMAELGDSEENFHITLGEQIAKAGVNLLITVGPLSAITAKSAREKSGDIEIKTFTNNTDVCNNLHNIIKDFDIILVKGSRINKLELVVNKLKEIIN